MTAGLEDVLVVTVRKSFWASQEAEAFPRRIYARVYYGHSTNFVNSLVVTLRALTSILVRPPRVVLLGSVERAVPWFIRARRLGLLRGAGLVVTNQLHLDDAQLGEVDRILLYSRALIARQRSQLRERAVFVPLPADGDLERARAAAVPGDYVFAGGGNDRDFGSVIEAVRGTDVSLEIVTFSRETLGYDRDLPPNCTVLWRMPPDEFLARAAGALLVVVPLRETGFEFGQTTVVQALALGKAVVATRAPSLLDYVEDGKEGILVEAGDVEGYRHAIARLLGDDELRRACERNALERAQALTYASFASTVADACRSLVVDARG
jgi:glycosyltransferase involved in cell wall biosynthesis